MGFDHIKRHGRRPDPKARGSAFAMKALGDVEGHDAPKIPLSRDVSETATATSVIVNEAMCVGRPHRETLPGTMQCSQGPESVAFAIDLKPRA
jgi:hypothetical protein